MFLLWNLCEVEWCDHDRLFKISYEGAPAILDFEHEADLFEWALNKSILIAACLKVLKANLVW